ncbi:MAG: hypothetical protein WCG87_07630 [Bacteroidota bacterium]
MKRIIILCILTITVISCKEAVVDHTPLLLSRIDSLEKKIANTYRPGLGEFMTEIQIHHCKLWFAGQHENWKLADFEVQEIEETLDNIKKYVTDRIEVAQVPMLQPALDSVNNAIKNKDLGAFRSSYTLLTNTCNTCHHAVKFDFNTIKIPDSPPFSDQVFEVGSK